MDGAEELEDDESGVWAKVEQERPNISNDNIKDLYICTCGPVPVNLDIR
jgi:hypothetical protein